MVARIDSWSKTHKQDLPVVITVGLSPGADSQANRATAAMGLYADLKIRSRLEEAFTLAIHSPELIRGHNPAPVKDGYHLLATYLFPWLTAKSWEELELNSAGEGLLQHGLGYNDPLVPLRELLELVEKEGGTQSITWIVFHGSSPLVSATASRFALGRTVDGPDVLICDELRGKAPIQNSVMLDRPTVDRSDVDHLPVDE